MDPAPLSSAWAPAPGAAGWALGNVGRARGRPARPGDFRGFVANRVPFLGSTDKNMTRLKLASAVKPVNCGDV